MEYGTHLQMTEEVNESASLQLKINKHTILPKKENGSPMSQFPTVTLSFFFSFQNKYLTSAKNK